MDPFSMLKMVLQTSFELQRRMDGVSTNKQEIKELRCDVRVFTGQIKHCEKALQDSREFIDQDLAAHLADVITRMGECLRKADFHLMTYMERKQGTGFRKIIRVVGDLVSADNMAKEIASLKGQMQFTISQWSAAMHSVIIARSSAKGEPAPESYSFNPEAFWAEFERRQQRYDDLDTAAYWDKLYAESVFDGLMDDGGLYYGSKGRRKQQGYGSYDDGYASEADDVTDDDEDDEDVYGDTNTHIYDQYPGSGRSRGSANRGRDAESCEEESLQMPDFIVARVTKAEKHPKSKRLRVCQLTLGPHHDAVQVVTSLLTVHADMLVIYMPVDTSSKQRASSYDDYDGYDSDDYLYDGAPSSSQKLRSSKSSKKLVEGVASVGRICTTVELECSAGGDNAGKVAVEVPDGLFEVGKEFEQKDLARVTRELQRSKAQEELLEECWDVSLDPIAARVTSVKQHPKSSKLLVCQLDAGKEQGCVQVVTECRDVEEGMLVIYAYPGCPMSAPGQDDAASQGSYDYGYNDGLYSDDEQDDEPEGPERAKKTIVAGVQTNGGIWSAEAAGWSDAPRAKQMVACLPSDAVDLGEEVTDEDLEYARKKWTRGQRR